MTPAVDRTVLDGLAARMGDRGPQFRATLIGTWTTEAAKRREQLADAAATGSADDLARTAHIVRSAAGSLGAHPVAELCSQVEDAVRTGRQVDVAAAAAQIIAELDRADAAFAELLAGP
ncbi:MAG: Hpt domain-containing protein [Mycobacteriales bacterium]|nr:Hpt domain-containing protein [Mycobacteriales bacterium]